MNVQPGDHAWIVGLTDNLTANGAVVFVESHSDWTPILNMQVWNCVTTAPIQGVSYDGEIGITTNLAIPDHHLKRINGEDSMVDEETEVPQTEKEQ